MRLEESGDVGVKILERRFIQRVGKGACQTIEFIG
jgi:hypothetical protein